ncbi:flagellar hook capping FlgD N-terminal domain-containing protein [Demequina aestuarii]|uniref:flagellar hook capping FlgD N-terminal domain-containing protein n=1 Tax=Demequina aestuarii TaxID=327095 RepID=UPI0007865B09|nr:flagellar hook capping FlgD N-terminal domain-containing protein [Demequina aestuarii]
MTIESTASTPGLNSGFAPATAPKQELDSEVFMSLLVAQLRNQDPSSPMDTNEMMSQQTQLASMEKLTQISETSQEQFALTMRMAAMGLVGSGVSYTDEDGTVVTGTAVSASFANVVPTISVDGTDVNLDHILAIQPSDD